jgi:hypothetical protein
MLRFNLVRRGTLATIGSQLLSIGRIAENTSGVKERTVSRPQHFLVRPAWVPYSIFEPIVSIVVSAAARLQPMRRSFTSVSEIAPPEARGPVMANRSARSTLPR